MSSTSTVKILAAWILIAGCAKGASDLIGSNDKPFPNYDAGPGGIGGSGADGGMGGSGAGGTGMPMFEGEACEQGAAQACTCEGSDSMGERMCLADASSPTGGALSECRNCPDAPDSGMTGGAGGASGMTGGASGMTGGASGMTGGAGGMTGGAGGMSGCMCMDALACCKDDGTCGVGAPGFCF